MSGSEYILLTSQRAPFLAPVADADITNRCFNNRQIIHERRKRKMPRKQTLAMVGVLFQLATAYFAPSSKRGVEIC